MTAQRLFSCPRLAAGVRHRRSASASSFGALPALLFALVWLSSPTAGASAGATSTALFPTGGSAAADQRRALDATLRKALEAEEGVALLSAAETSENVKFMAEGGALCTPSDLDCLQKFGLIATVDQLLVAEARGRRTLEVTLSVVDVASGQVVRTADAALTPKDAAAVAALVRRALRSDDDDKKPETPPAGSTATAPARPVAGPVVDETELRGLQLAGAWTAGIGGGVGALGLLGALGGEAVFWTGSGSKEVRGGIVRPFAQTMWLVTIAGVIAAGVGGGLYLAESPAPPARIDP